MRTVFCLFADDTGIFEPRDLFLDLLETRTREDGSDLGPALARLFQVLNTPVGQRQAKLDEDLARFPYVNGDLFAARLTIPDFDAAMRSDQRQIEFPQRRLEIPTQGLKKKSCSRPLRRPFPRSSFL